MCPAGHDEYRPGGAGRYREISSCIESSEFEKAALRVRGGERVRLAVYLKALACNVKRMVRARLDEMFLSFEPAVFIEAVVVGKDILVDR